ncbi:4'-phosphopantetheinyl transferase [[Leptolyngbya] sp. PCC 7376]|uniref:4'-phosphopantetheinyl transferase family protein n=1 Tax=[Leptolyngbya] sp. PCC 7376 TaxID=111781 RepID=UPI00029F335F|nr:4'-phosphopantetheinyl transferase superfamily protein [[Leptolyngbya] sp. PCC 7376]AFY40409.1 4'-phosphopantetheinyl transferase [[Leptolyngbya] sp. PCC 7376]
MSFSVERWLISFQDTAQKSKELITLLSVDEQERAKRFKFTELQDRFIVGRGSLRQILGSYLQQHPAEIEFSYGEYGKPFVEKLSFNFSHTKEYALCVVSQEEAIAVGVDIETQDRGTQALALAQRFFHPDEYSYLQTVPVDKQQDIFLQFWTAKEAYLKAKGIGLQGGLDQFQIQLESTPHIICSDAENWSLKMFQINTNHQGAIAVNSAQCHHIDRGIWGAT